MTPHGGFFVTGGSLQPDAPSYVDRRADRELYDGLQAREFCYVLTARQMGKSSLMVRTARRLREAGTRVAVLDLTAVGQNLSAEQWYYSLLYRLADQLDRVDEADRFWERHPRMGPLHRFMAALQEVLLAGEPLVVFVDEIDVVRSLPFSTDEFFAAVRECYNRRTEEAAFRRLTFCLLGVASPHDLIRDTRITPFNIGRRIELGDFTAAEAGPLQRGFGRQKGPAAGLLERVLYWTGGHPYLTQRLGSELAARWTSEGRSHGGGAGSGTRPFSRRAARKRVDAVCAELFLSHGAQERDDNLIFVRERLLRSDHETAAVLDLYARVRRGERIPDDDTNPLVDALVLAGACRVRRGVLTVRNRIYARVFDREWVRKHMPDAELLRQRAAYRRGLVRAGALAGLVLAVVTALAGAAVAQAGRADRKAAEATRLAGSLTRALEGERRETRRADREATRAGQESQAAKQARNRALAAQAHAEEQRRLAERRLVRAHVAAGNRLVDEGDLLAALPWFVEALRLERGGREREEIHRLRIGATLAQCPPLAHLWFHGDSVTSVQFSADGRRVLTAGADRTVRLWDAASGEPVLPALKHRAAVTTARLSPDGRNIAAGCVDGTVLLWDAVTGRRRDAPARHAGHVSRVEFSPDGRLLLTASHDRTARLWDVAGGRAVGPPLRHQAPVAWAAFAPGGGRVLTAGGGRSHNHIQEARLWAVPSGARETSPLPFGRRPWESVTHAAYSPDGRRVALAMSSGSVRLVDPGSGSSSRTTVTHQASVYACAFSPDGRRLATGACDQTARVWDAETGSAVTGPLAHPNEVWQVEFSPDGRRVATGCLDGAVRVWDPATGARLLPPLRHRTPITCLAFDPQGRRIVTGSEDGTARVWELSVPLAPARDAIAEVFRPEALSADGRRHVAVEGSKSLRVRDLATGRPIGPPLPHRGGGLMRLNADGRRLFQVEGGGEARVWDSRPFGSGAASATARVWEVGAGKRRLPPLVAEGPIESAAFSPDGRRIVTTSWNGLAQVWDAATGKATTPPLRHEGPVRHAAVSADGRLAATGSDDGTARVWDVETGEPVTPPLRHGGRVWAVAFEKGGRKLFTSSAVLITGEAEPGASFAAQSWELAPTELALPDLQNLACALSGKRFDPGMGVMGVPAAVYRQTWEALRPHSRDALPAVRKSSLAGRRRAGGRTSGVRAGGSPTWDVGSRGVVQQGLQLASGVDGVVRFERRAGSPCAATAGDPARSLYLYYRFRPRPRDGPAYLTVEYWDGRAGFPLDLDYDGRAENRGVIRGSYTPPEARAGGFRLGSGEWRRAHFRLDQPRFRGRQHMVCDFRLFAMDGPIWVRKVVASPRKPGDWDALSRPDTELAEIDRLLRVRPRSLVLLQRRLDLHRNASRWGEVIADASRIIARAPKMGSAYRDRADALMALGKPDLAFPEAEGALLLALEARNPFPRFWGVYGRAAAAAKRTEAASAFLAGLTNPWDEPWRLPFLTGWAFERMGQPQKALEAYDRAAGLGDDGEIFLRRAQVRSGQQQWTAAIEDYSRALDRVSDQPQTLADRARAYLQLGRAQEARQDILEAMKSRAGQSRADFRAWLAFLQLSEGDRPGYRRTCDEMVRRFRASREFIPLDWTVWTCAVTPDAVPDYLPLVEMARRAVGTGVRPDAAWEDVGAILFRAGRFGEAQPALERAIRARAEAQSRREGRIVQATPWAAIAFFRAMAHYRLGRVEESRKHLAEGVRLAERALSATPPPDWIQKLVIEQLRAEARALIGTPEEQSSR